MKLSDTIKLMKLSDTVISLSHLTSYTVTEKNVLTSIHFLPCQESLFQ